MAVLDFKRNKSNYEVSVSYSKRSKSHYHTIIDKDPNKIAQVLIDLHLEGFPIEESIKRFNLRKIRKDWLGL